MRLCPRRPFVLYRLDNPEIKTSSPCGSYECTTCVKQLIGRRVRLMAWGIQQAETVRFITLTLVPEDFQQARSQIRDLVRRLRQKYQLEWAWSIEENPAKTGYHAHALQWGTWIDRGEMCQMWGGRRVDIGKVKFTNTDYLVKCRRVAGYAAKDVAKHLRINGGRPVHMSRGYLWGMTSREVSRLSMGSHKWKIRKATDTEIGEQDVNPMSWGDY